MSQRLGNAVGPVGVIGRDFYSSSVELEKTLGQKLPPAIRSQAGFLQPLPIPIQTTEDLTEFGGNTARGASFHFVILTFVRKQIVGRA